MKVLVTGASGFIGRNTLLKLPADWQVVALYNQDATFPAFLREHQLHHITPMQIDLTNQSALNSVDAQYKNYDACIYLAANGDPAYSQQDPIMDLNANTYALLNTLSAWRFGHFIYFSSGAVYDGLVGAVNPESHLAPALPYAISKWASERYIMFAKKQGWVKQATIVRFFGAYGMYEAPRKIYGRLINQFAIERQPKFTIRGDGKNLIDAMHVDDTVHAIMLLLEKSEHDQVIDLYSGRPLTLAALVQSAAETFNLQAEIEFVDHVPEYIEFYSTDRTMELKYGFKPSIPLADGLRQFHSQMNVKTETN